MKNQIAKIATFGLVAASLALVPAISRSQDNTSDNTNAPAQTAPKKHHATPFHGSVDAVDTGASTLTVGALVLNITSKTKISNVTNSEPAVLGDILVGEYVSGSYTKDEAGNLNARVVHIGKRAHKEAAKPRHKRQRDEFGDELIIRKIRRKSLMKR